MTEYRQYLEIMEWKTRGRKRVLYPYIKENFSIEQND